MQSIIKSAMDNEHKRDRKRPELSSEFDKELEKILQSHRTIIKVVGTGGAGNNTINRLMEIGVKNVETIAVNTDAQDLLYAIANKKILIGKTITNGLGAGSDPEIGEESAKENLEDVKSTLAGSDMVFVTCGLGGGTGSGSAPVIAEIARGSGALTIAIVTIPFSEEGVLRWKNAQYGLERLRKAADTVIVIQNDKLWEIAPEIPLNDAFKLSDEILVNGVMGITELVTEKGLVNLDFADVRTIMQNGGTALIGLGESDSANRAVEAVEIALQNPLVDLDIVGAKSALMNIMGGTDMSVKDAKTAMQTLAKKLDPNARVIWGARVNPDLNNSVRVMIIATGLRERENDRNLGKSTKLNPAVHAPYEDHFQIKEQEESSSESKSKHERGETEAKESGKTKKIFQEILEEESDADLQAFQEALVSLSGNILNWNAWDQMKAASSSLSGTAQMFDFYEISRLMTEVEDFISVVQKRKQVLPDSFVKILEELPDLFLDMIHGEESAAEFAEEFQTKLVSFREYLEVGDDLSPETVAEKAREMVSALVEKGNSDSGGDPDGSKKKDLIAHPKKDKNIQSVNDAVKYVDNLLKGLS